MSAEVLVNSPHMEANVIPLQAMNAMQLVGDNEAITDEITTFVTPGHTPGHQSFLISSGGERAIIIGDAFHTAAQLTETSWNVGFDVNKPLAAETRSSLVQTHRGRRFDRRVRSHARRLKHRAASSAWRASAPGKSSKGDQMDSGFRRNEGKSIGEGRLTGVPPFLTP